MLPNDPTPVTADEDTITQWMQAIRKADRAHRDIHTFATRNMLEIYIYKQEMIKRALRDGADPHQLALAAGHHSIAEMIEATNHYLRTTPGIGDPRNVIYPDHNSSRVFGR